MTYDELLDKKISDDEAVALLLVLAQKDYLKLLHEMIDHEEKTHSMEKYLQNRFYKGSKILPGQSVILDQFKMETSSSNIELYKKTARVVGEGAVIKSQSSLFFIPLRDKLLCDRGAWTEPGPSKDSEKPNRKNLSLEVYWKLGVAIVKKIYPAIIVGVSFVIIFIGVYAFMLKPLILCSQFNGTLVSAYGEPQVGVKVTRSWNWAWKNENGLQETVTDSEGKFSFPEVSKKSFSASIFPHEPVVKQSVVAKVNSKDIELFVSSKHDYSKNGEVGLDERRKKDVLNFICDVEGASKYDEIGQFYGVCKLTD